MLSDDQLREFLVTTRVIAVYGMSRHPHKAAYYVPARLMNLGFEIIPVNPFASEIMGRRAYQDLLSIPESIDIVEVFRPSSEALAVVTEALSRHHQRGDIRMIWLQSGIRDEHARRLAQGAGILFVQDRCMAVEVPRLLPEGIAES